MNNMKSNNKEVFSKNLVKYMKLYDKTQTDIAKLLGISVASVNDWINERTYPRMDKVQLLAEHFGVNISDLLEEKVEEKAKETIAISKKDQEVLDLFHKVPEDKREFVLTMIRAAIYNL